MISSQLLLRNLYKRKFVRKNYYWPRILFLSILYKFLKYYYYYLLDGLGSPISLTFLVALLFLLLVCSFLFSPKSSGQNHTKEIKNCIIFKYFPNFSAILYSKRNKYILPPPTKSLPTCSCNGSYTRNYLVPVFFYTKSLFSSLNLCHQFMYIDASF